MKTGAFGGREIDGFAFGQCDSPINVGPIILSLRMLDQSENCDDVIHGKNIRVEEVMSPWMTPPVTMSSRDFRQSEHFLHVLTYHQFAGA